MVEDGRGRRGGRVGAALAGCYRGLYRRRGSGGFGRLGAAAAAGRQRWRRLGTLAVALGREVDAGGAAGGGGREGCGRRWSGDGEGGGRRRRVVGCTAGDGEHGGSGGRRVR